MSTKTTNTIIGALVAMSLAASAVMAQQAGAGKPQERFKETVKVFILAGQSNMEGHAGVQTLDRLGEHLTHGYPPQTRVAFGLVRLARAGDVERTCPITTGP